MNKKLIFLKKEAGFLKSNLKLIIFSLLINFLPLIMCVSLQDNIRINYTKNEVNQVVYSLL